jgi:hypothetical protein
LESLCIRREGEELFQNLSIKQAKVRVVIIALLFKHKGHPPTVVVKPEG